MSQLTRRSLLGSLGCIAMSQGVRAQPAKSPIRVRSLNHMTLAVADPGRPLEFYQGLFGMPVQARQGATTVLRIGSGPQFLALNKAGANAKPAIHHFCMTVENFDPDRILKILEDLGVSRAEAAGAGPMKSWIRRRGEDAGGAKEGTAELYFTDADGIVAQLQDASYCGGAGRLGEACLGKPQPAPRK